MNRKTIIMTPALAIAFAVATNLRAAPAPNTASTEGVTVETGGVALEAVKETPAQRDARMKWWREAKFGLFIHWGVYAVPAGKYGEKTNYGEWIMQSARIPVADLSRLCRSSSIR
jgi:alpha-L-fucosidase